jgi:xanthine dehydrogenase accessory factor
VKPTELFSVLKELAESGQPFALATVVRVEGSTIGRPGFKVVITGDGKIAYGGLGGVCPESAIIPVAQEAIRTGTPRTVKVYLESVEKAVEATVRLRKQDEIYVETNCGGMMEIYVEPYLSPDRIVIVAQGGKDDVEEALIRLAKLMDFEVVLINHNPVLTEKPDLLISELDYDISNFQFKPTDSVVVLTKGARDVAVLEALSKVRVRFVGLLASRKRVAEDLQALRERGVSEEFLASLHAPVGVDIGAVTPAEIALSILADVVATKYGRHLPHKPLPALGEARVPKPA